MATGAPIDDLCDTVRAALEAAYERGVKAGADAKTAEMLAVLGVRGHAGTLLTSTVLGRAGLEEDKPPRAPPQMKGPRAPKGLVGSALQHIFREAQGLTTKDIETRALTYDPRINPKTVYNELWRRTELYRQDSGRWFSVSPLEGALMNPLRAALGDDRHI